jgi:hypothetical protein
MELNIEARGLENTFLMPFVQDSSMTHPFVTLPRLKKFYKQKVKELVLEQFF